MKHIINWAFCPKCNKQEPCEMISHTLNYRQKKVINKYKCNQGHVFLTKATL